MYLVGLTGGIATGKSTVACMLKELGCPVVDADLIAREVVEPGKPALKKIVEVFGGDIIRDDGTLDREKLGEQIFSDPAKRRKLNSITHPEILKSMLKKVLWHAGTGEQFVILDLPLLFETSKMVTYMAEILVISCDDQTQLDRLMARNNFSEEEAIKRIQSQMSLKEKCKRATRIIDNSNSIEDTQRQVERIFKELRRSKRHWLYRAVFLSAMMSIIAVVCYSVNAILSFM